MRSKRANWDIERASCLHGTASAPSFQAVISVESVNCHYIFRWATSFLHVLYRSIRMVHHSALVFLWCSLVLFAAMRLRMAQWLVRSFRWRIRWYFRQQAIEECFWIPVHMTMGVRKIVEGKDRIYKPTLVLRRKEGPEESISRYLPFHFNHHSASLSTRDGLLLYSGSHLYRSFYCWSCDGFSFVNSDQTMDILRGKAITAMVLRLELISYSDTSFARPRELVSLLW